MTSRFLHGTSSWSEKSWGGVFYPRGLKPAEWLRHYATQFPAVEADSTYYHAPTPQVVDGWRDKTPPGFALAAKFPGAITHGGRESTPDRDVLLVWEKVGDEALRFIETMARLEARCGPLVLQFPYFNRDAFATPHEFLERLDAFLARLPRGCRYAVEVRNKHWLRPALASVLRRHGVALVLVDLAYMPHPDEYPYDFDPVTADFAYVRLIGDRHAIDALTTRFDRIVVDHGARLARWSAVVRRLMQRVPEVFAFANNHYAGHGPATIRTLAELLGRGL